MVYLICHKKVIVNNGFLPQKIKAKGYCNVATDELVVSLKGMS